MHVATDQPEFVSPSSALARRAARMAMVKDHQEKIGQPLPPEPSAAETVFNVEEEALSHVTPSPSPQAAQPIKQPAHSSPRVVTAKDAFIAMAAQLDQVKELDEVILTLDMARVEESNKIVQQNAAKLRVRTPYVEITNESFGILFDRQYVGLEILAMAEVQISYKGNSYRGVCMASQITFPGTTWVYMSFVLPDTGAM